MNVLRAAIVVALLLAPLPAASQEAPAGTQWKDARPVTVHLSSFRFDPSVITLQHGETYELRLDNRSSGGHDFAAREFFAAARVMDADRAKISGGKVALKGGASAEIRFVAPPPGTYHVHCTHFLHGTFGMTGEIVVQ